VSLTIRHLDKALDLRDELTKVDTSRRPFEYACTKGTTGLRTSSRPRGRGKGRERGSRERDHARRAGGRGEQEGKRELKASGRRECARGPRPYLQRRWTCR